MFLLKKTDKTQYVVMSSSFESKETCVHTDLIMNEMGAVQTYAPPPVNWKEREKKTKKIPKEVVFQGAKDVVFHGNHPVINLQ